MGPPLLTLERNRKQLVSSSTSHYHKSL